MKGDVDMKDCDCPDWKEGIAEIWRFISLGNAHGMHYKAKFFIHCPWCGKKREEKS